MRFSTWDLTIIFLEKMHTLKKNLTCFAPLYLRFYIFGIQEHIVNLWDQCKKPNVNIFFIEAPVLVGLQFFGHRSSHIWVIEHRGLHILQSLRQRISRWYDLRPIWRLALLVRPEADMKTQSSPIYVIKKKLKKASQASKFWVSWIQQFAAEPVLFHKNLRPKLVLLQHIRHDTTRHDKIQHDTTRHDTTRH